MSTARAILFASLFVVSMFTGQVHLQSQMPVVEIFVGTTFPRPSIDGLWQSQQLEWAGAIGYTLPIGADPMVSPSIRLMHDNTTLYGLIDVPPDLGGSGRVVLRFYTNATAAEENLTVSFSAGQPQLVLVNASEPVVGLIRQHARVATTLSATVHSQSKHRVWEFSIQLSPFLLRSVLDGTSMGFQVTVTDSTGNQFSLVGANQSVEMILTTTVECVC